MESEMIMLALPQTILMRWNSSNRDWYESKGYKYTKFRDPFHVRVDDLPPSSKQIVNVICDYCNKTFTKDYFEYRSQRENSLIKKDSCRDCYQLKRSENDFFLKSQSKHLISVPDSKRGTVYELTTKYSSLEGYGKFLIDEIKRFCEVNDRFPQEKEISIKNGYIGRSQIYKYFNRNSFTVIYDYIRPIIQQKPESYCCNNCNKELPFTQEYFTPCNASSFGLKKVCKDCNNESNYKRRYRKLGLEFDKEEDISPIVWWEALYAGRIHILPEFCFNKENMYKIIRHVYQNVMKLKDKTEICAIKAISKSELKKYRIYHLYLKISSKLTMLQGAFPELNITKMDLERCFYDEEVMETLLSNWINGNNFSVIDLLQRGITYKFPKRLKSMSLTKFENKNKMLIWYFKRKSILHPITNQEITMDDFQEKPPKYWEDEENRLIAIRKYCSEHGINDCLVSTESLKRWAYNNFRQNQVTQIFTYSNYYISLYDLLSSAYPIIKENKLLFEWEWHQYNNNSMEKLILMLREFILYRLNDFIVDPINDIPHFLNYKFMSVYYPKFNKQIVKRRFANYFEWSSMAFPEYAAKWTYEKFGLCATYDGSICHSLEEKIIYEHIKINLGIKSLKLVGTFKNSKYVFILPKEHDDQYYCPDFVIDSININGKNTKLVKPIIIEYYGMYNEKYNTSVLKAYREKTHRKNEYYNSLSEIKFIPLYPDDFNDIEIINKKIHEALKEVG